MMLGGARTAIHDATAQHLLNRSDLNVFALGTRVDKSTAGSNDSMIVDAVEAGRILAAVYKQRPAVRYWLLYAYAAEPNRNHRAYLAHDIYRVLFAPNESRLKLKREKMLKLCSAAIDDLKSRHNNGRKLPVPFLAACVDVHVDSFRRFYVRPMKDAQRKLDDYDREGLGAVSEVVRELRDGKKRAPLGGVLCS